MVRHTRHSSQCLPHCEPVRSEDLLEAGAWHRGSCIEHHPARRREDARDLGRHRANAGFGQVVAHDACRMHEFNSFCVDHPAFRIVQRLRDGLIHELHLQRCATNIAISAMRGACEQTITEVIAK